MNTPQTPSVYQASAAALFLFATALGTTTDDQANIRRSQDGIDAYFAALSPKGSTELLYATYTLFVSFLHHVAKSIDIDVNDLLGHIADAVDDLDALLDVEGDR